MRFTQILILFFLVSCNVAQMKPQLQSGAQGSGGAFGNSVSFTDSQIQGSESFFNAIIPITLKQPLLNDTDVFFEFSGSATPGTSCTSGVDYVLPLELKKNIPAGASSAVLILPICNDNIFEGDEVIQISITGTTPSIGVASPSTINYILKEKSARPVVTFSSVSTSVAELNSGSVVHNIPITLTRPSVETVTVDVVITGNATRTNNACGIGNGDYRLVLANPNIITVTFPPEVTSFNIPVEVCGDLIIESNETIGFSLQPPVNGTLGGQSTHVFTIENDDFNVDGGTSLLASMVTPALVVSEGNSASVCVVLNGVKEFTTQLNYAVDFTVPIGGSVRRASFPSDFSFPGSSSTMGSVAIAPSQPSACFAVQIKLDELFEGNEVIHITILPSEHILPHPSLPRLTEIQIPANDASLAPRLVFSKSNQIILESNEAQAVEVRLVSQTNEALEKAAGVDVVFNINTTSVAGSPAATAGTDYFINNTILTGLVIPAGQTSLVLPLSVHQDGIDEFDEKFRLTLDPVTAGVSVGGMGEQVITIVDMDPSPQVNFSATQSSLANHPSDEVTYHLSLNFSGLSEKGVQVFYNSFGSLSATDSCGIEALELPGFNTSTLSGSFSFSAISTLTHQFSIKVCPGIYPPENNQMTLELVGANNLILGPLKSHLLLMEGVATLPSLSFAGASGTTGQVRAAMSVSPTLLSANAPVTNCTAAPALPAGLVIHPQTCVISGQPTVAITATVFTVSAFNVAGVTTATVELTINPSAPGLSYIGSAGIAGNVGVAMNVAPSLFFDNGSALTGCISSPVLSGGLTLNSTTCVISGTPTAVLAATSYTITATNAIGSTSALVTLSVAPSAPTLTYEAALGGVATPLTVNPLSLLNNGAAITSCSISPALPTPLTINNATCVISGTPTALLAATTYTVTATNSVGSTTASLNLTIGPGIPTISYAGSTGTTVNLTEAMNVAPTTLNDNGAAITGCSSTPALPFGLSLNATTCVISGTPTGAASSDTYTITATNATGSASATVDLIVIAPPPTITYAAAGNAGSISQPMTVVPETFNDNGTSITNCTVLTTLPSGLSLDSGNCEITGTPTGAPSIATYTVTATNAGGSTTASVKLAICPLNFVAVSANSGLGVSSDFCVAQFEMKDVAGVATSQAAVDPWVSISQTAAKTACTSLGAGYDLISNPEWMTIAHEIERTADNWSSGLVGDGFLNRGHSDDSPSFACDATQETVETDCTTSDGAHDQKRTHTLSNGQVIWDIAGNVWEWTDWSLGGGLTSGPTSCADSFIELPNIPGSCGALAATEYRPDNPEGVADIDYNSDYGLGQIFGGVGGAARRGGSWNATVFAGAFTLALNSSAGFSDPVVGFRCVFRP